MPWKTDGDYYGFKPESVKLCAPAASGVYGLFNFRHQILIGAAANIRTAVLDHHKHTNFRFKRFEPTGFTFEICAAELRESRALELAAEYQPISGPQNPIGFATLWRSWRAPEARAFQVQANPTAHPGGTTVAPVTAKRSNPRRQVQWRVGCAHFGLAGAVCAVVLLTIGMIGLMPHLKIIFDKILRSPAAVAESRPQPSSSEIHMAQAPKIVADPVSDGIAVASAPVNAQPGAAENSVGEASRSTESAKPYAAPPIDAAATVSSSAGESEKSAKRTRPAPSWSVQALATTEKQLASDWLDKLKAKGFDAFVIEADVHGKTWHRVRIGNFAARRDAENLRGALKANEGFRDAFVAAIDNAEATIAMNRR